VRWLGGYWRDKRSHQGLNRRLRRRKGVKDNVPVDQPVTDSPPGGLPGSPTDTPSRNA
jgi:hypothetical protein